MPWRRVSVDRAPIPDPSRKTAAYPLAQARPGAIGQKPPFLVATKQNDEFIYGPKAASIFFLLAVFSEAFSWGL